MGIGLIMEMIQTQARSRTHGEFCMRTKMRIWTFSLLPCIRMKIKIPQNSAEESFQTVLLSERPAEGEEVRRLSALNGSDEDIVISYFPFVIGKHKDLADYVLLKDTVSRFHIRLDENNGRYTVTDLNSTNGTRVRGRLLEANETTQLDPGDQIFIADCGYIFG